MIIKTLRWKVGGFGRLIDYVGKELVAYVGKEEDGSSMILHNLRYTDDLNEVAKQFAANDVYRKRRKNGVAMYHEILSFHVRDREAITPEVLEDVTREYLRLRAPRALAFASPHHDRDHVHVHIAISGTEFRSSKTLRMNNRTFTEVRRQIEAYQLSRYPELKHSIVHLPKRVRNQELQGEIEKERPVIERCFAEAHGLDDFFERVAQAGINESKYPLDRDTGCYTFDVDLARLTELDLRMCELQALQKLRVVREHLEFSRDEVLDEVIERYERNVKADTRQDTHVDQCVRELESLQREGQSKGQEVEFKP